MSHHHHHHRSNSAREREEQFVGPYKLEKTLGKGQTGKLLGFIELHDDKILYLVSINWACLLSKMIPNM